MPVRRDPNRRLSAFAHCARSSHPTITCVDTGTTTGLRERKKAATRQALHGLGERLEAEGGAERFLAWAAEAIATHKEGQHGGRLEPDEIPDFVDDLMGPFQGVRSVGVDSGDDPSVTLYTGGSAYHFTIRLRPSRVRHGPWSWWVGEVAGELEWRPGIDLATEGK